MWVRSFRAPIQAVGTHGLTQLYREAWDNDYHTRVPFFFSLKKKNLLFHWHKNFVRKHLICPLIFVKSSLILMPIGAQEANSPRRLRKIRNRNRITFRTRICIRWNIVLRSSILWPNVKERFEVQRVIAVLDLSIAFSTSFWLALVRMMDPVWDCGVNG